MSETERKAKALLSQGGLNEKSYEKLLKDGYTGFAHFYLDKKSKVATLSTDAKLNTLLEFARFDLEFGTTVAKLVYACCQWAPIKTWVESLINLDTVTPKDELIKEVLTYKNDDGWNCLIKAFEMLSYYWNKFYMQPDLSHQLMSGAEGSVQYLIRLGDKHGVEMKTVLNEMTNDGRSLFHEATWFSEKLSTQLLQRGVKTNTVNHLFQTPEFRVS